MHGNGGDAILLIIKNRYCNTGDAEHKFFIVYADVAHIDAFQFRIPFLNIGERVGRQRLKLGLFQQGMALVFGHFR